MNDRGVSVVWEGAEDLDLFIGDSIGPVDDAERCFAARYQEQGRPYILGGRQLVGDRRPDAERLRRRLAVFSSRHPVRIGDSEPTVAERLGEREIRRDPESMVLLLGAINTS
jgi:hypothetical protein